MSNWWYAISHTKNGPITLADLVQLFRTGQVDLETLVWEKGMQAWQPIGSMPHLMSVFGTLPKPTQVADDSAQTDTDKPRVDTTRVDTPGLSLPKPEKKSGSFIFSAFVWLGVFGVFGLAAYFYVSTITIPTVASPAAGTAPKPIVASPPTEAAPKVPPSGLLWTNPTTNVHLRIESGWTYSSKVNAKGLLQHIFKEEKGRSYISLTGQPSYRVNWSDHLAAFQKENIERIEFKGPATESIKNGALHWRRVGMIKNTTNYKVRVEIVKSLNVLWEVEVIEMDDLVDFLKVNKLVSGLLTTFIFPL